MGCRRPRAIWATRPTWARHCHDRACRSAARRFAEGTHASPSEAVCICGANASHNAAIRLGCMRTRSLPEEKFRGNLSRADGSHVMTFGRTARACACGPKDKGRDDARLDRSRRTSRASARANVILGDLKREPWRWLGRQGSPPRTGENCARCSDRTLRRCTSGDQVPRIARMLNVQFHRSRVNEFASRHRRPMFRMRSVRATHLILSVPDDA